MKLSKKKQAAYDKAVHDTIMNLRLQIMRPSNLHLTKEAFDEELFKLGLRLTKAIDAALGLERD